MSDYQSATVGALAKALAAAQLSMRDAKKDSVNPHFKNTYATLASVRAAITKPLADHGMAVVQSFEPHGEAGICIITTLMHESGEWVQSRLFVPVTKKDAQGFGSAISYGRRYSLAAIAGIAADDDDDGNAATEKPKATESAPSVNGEIEQMLATLFDLAKTNDDLAAVTQKTSEAVKAGSLTNAARARLRTKMGEAQTRVGGAAA